MRQLLKALQTHTLRYYKEYDLQLMNLDTTVRHLRHTNKDCFQKQENKKKSKRNCYNCDIGGHFMCDCWKSKKPQQLWSLTNTTTWKNHILTVTNIIKLDCLNEVKKRREHDCLSWIVCYDDTCTTHHSDKDESEWFLKSSKKAQQL